MIAGNQKVNVLPPPVGKIHKKDSSLSDASTISLCESVGASSTDAFNLSNVLKSPKPKVSLAKELRFLLAISISKHNFFESL